VNSDTGIAFLQCGQESFITYSLPKQLRLVKAKVQGLSTLTVHSPSCG